MHEGFFLYLPAFNKMAKSATSCGTSCSRMQNVVVTPTLVETKNEPATAMPCEKLSMLLANKFK